MSLAVHLSLVLLASAAPVSSDTRRGTSAAPETGVAIMFPNEGETARLSFRGSRASPADVTELVAPDHDHLLVFATGPALSWHGPLTVVLRLDLATGQRQVIAR